MSIAVDLDTLAEVLADFTLAYLVTVGDDHRAHAVAVDAVLTEGALHIASAGNATRRNASDHPDVTLLWPPQESGGHTLIVDGRAAVNDAGLRIQPTGAVLHRPAAPGVRL